MSDGTAPRPQPQALPPRTLPVSGADLLLILIITLGSVRLLAGLIVALRVAPQGDAPGLQLVLGVLLFQTLAILGAIWFVVLRKYGLRWADLGLRPGTSQWHRRGLALAVLLLPMVAVITGFVPPPVAVALAGRFG